MRRASRFQLAAACAALGLVLAVFGGGLAATHRSTETDRLDRTLSTTAGEKAALVDGQGSAEGALDRADRALYAAKRSGRNCVRRFSDLDETDAHADAVGPGATTSLGDPSI